jgi:hypothetical protein
LNHFTVPFAMCYSLVRDLGARWLHGPTIPDANGWLRHGRRG